jgi:hypothetical protein
MSITERKANHFFNEIGRGYGCTLRSSNKILRVRKAGFGGGYAIMYTDGNKLEIMYSDRVSVEIISSQITVKYGGPDSTNTVTFNIATRK